MSRVALLEIPRGVNLVRVIHPCGLVESLCIASARFVDELSKSVTRIRSPSTFSNHSNDLPFWAGRLDIIVVVACCRAVMVLQQSWIADAVVGSVHLKSKSVMLLQTTNTPTITHPDAAFRLFHHNSKDKAVVHFGSEGH